MAQNDTASIKLVVDAAEYLNGLKRAGKLSEKEYSKMLSEFMKAEEQKQKRLDRNERDQKKRLARETARTKRATQQQTKDRLESFKKFGEAAQGSIGAATGRIFALGEGITKLASTAGPFGIAAIAIAGIGTAGVLAFAAIAAAAVAATVKLHQFLLSAEETRKELEPLYKLGTLQVIPPDQVNALRGYAANWAAVKTLISDLSVAIGGNLAKNLEAVSFEVLTLSIYVSDLVKMWLRGNSLIGEYLKKMVEFRVNQVFMAVKALAAPIITIVKAFELMGAVAQGSAAAFTKEIGDAQKAVVKFTDTKVDEFVENGAAAFAKLTPGLEKARIRAILLKNDMIALETAQNAAADSAKNLAERQKEAAKNQQELRKWFVDYYKGVASDAKSLTDTLTGVAEGAAAAALTPIEAINDRASKELAKVDDTAQKLAERLKTLEQGLRVQATLGDGADTQLLQKRIDEARAALEVAEQARIDIVQNASDKIKEIRDKDHAEQLKRIQAEADAQNKNTQATVKSVSDTVGAFGKFAEQQAANAEAGTEAQKRAAMAAYAINKASAIAQITFSTAVAIMEAMKIPPPFGQIQAAAVGATGAVQLASVVSTPPPSFHMGGAISATSQAPDEVMIRAKSGEGVLTSAGMKAIGGPQGLNQMNRGASPQEITVVQKYQHRTLSAVLEDSVRMTNSPIRRAIKGKKKAGHRG